MHKGPGIALSSKGRVQCYSIYWIPVIHNLNHNRNPSLFSQQCIFGITIIITIKKNEWQSQIALTKPKGHGFH